jgi:hypothetical protein
VSHDLDDRSAVGVSLARRLGVAWPEPAPVGVAERVVGA